MRPTYKFKTNIPTAVFFQSNEPQTGTGKYGQWYRYDVLIDSIEQVIFVSRVLQNLLSSLGNLYGRTLEITKKEGENNRIYWELSENGEIVTPTFNKTTEFSETEKFSTAENAATAFESDPLLEASQEERLANLERRLNSASSVVSQLINRVQSIESEVEDLRQRVGFHASSNTQRFEE